MSHEYHPREGAPDEPILFDGCGRCADQAADPITQCAEARVRALYRKAVEVEHFNRGHYRSHAEVKGCHAMWRVALFLERHLAYDVAQGAGIDPWSLFE